MYNRPGLNYWDEDLVGGGGGIVEMNQEDEDSDLVERAEGVDDNHANYTAQVIGRFVSSLRNAIARTMNEGLKIRMKHVRGRLLGILAVRNEERVEKLLKDADEMLDATEQYLASAMQVTSTRETILQFDMAEGSMRLAGDFLREMQERKYLKEVAKKRQSEIDLLQERLKRLRVESNKRPQVVRAARERDESAQQQLQQRAQQVVEEEVRFRAESLAVCRARMEAGDLAGAKLLLGGIEPVNRKMVRKSDGCGYTFIPDDPELVALDERLVALSIAEATRLKGLVDGCVAQQDFAGAMQHITALGVLDPRAITNVFGGPEQVAMLKQRCYRQKYGARKSPREIHLLK